jgi:hypothetical protein
MIAQVSISRSQKKAADRLQRVIESIDLDREVYG